MKMPADVIPFRKRDAGSPRALPSLKRRVAFVINSLGPGGAERVLNNVLHMTPLEDWAPHLILLDREKEHRTPPDFVPVHRLDCRMSLVPSIRQLRRKLKEIAPDLIVSFLVRANVASVIAGRGIAPVVISERSQLSTHLAERHAGLKHWAAASLPRLFYRHGDHIIAVSEGVRSDLIRHFGVPAKRVESIPNPFDLDRIVSDGREPAEFPLPPRFMVGVGRLTAAKGPQDLIEAYALAKPDIPLCLLGDGPDRPRLEARIAELGLSDRIRLLGYARNPFAIVSRAELFVSGSHCEGFPNAMAEAMALGLPVVATDCPSGPAEILEGVETTGTTAVFDAKYGLLAPVKQPHILAQAMQRMAAPELRQHYACVARRRMEDFRIETIAARYWRTFADVQGRRAHVTAPAPQSPRPADRERA
ncbi:MAG TPA: glycosyltransferase [Hyphomonadaceae bacterium]|nr:glycosyltransferase [Hyphomonadaceae bacterium]